MFRRLAVVHAILAAAKVARASPGSVRGSNSSKMLNATLGAMAAEHGPGSDSWVSSDAWMAEFCSSKCKAAGYCCNDYQVGSNQMISCSQACMMRARGSTVAEMVGTGGLCNRNGQSGCSLNVNGHAYGFCSTCSDLTSSPQCTWGVASSAACEHGASLAPTPGEYCGLRCKAAGYCCNDWKVGSNQMISCAQACMMRTLGTGWREMASSLGGLCSRHGQSGCSLDVNGHRYDFCSVCSDLTSSPQCKWGVASSVACDIGAMIPPSRWGFKA